MPADSVSNNVPDYLSLMRLDDRGFVVLGAGQGIGAQTVHALTHAGARVLCVDQDEKLARDIADQIGGEAMKTNGGGTMSFVGSLAISYFWSRT